MNIPKLAILSIRAIHLKIVFVLYLVFFLISENHPLYLKKTNMYMGKRIRPIFGMHLYEFPRVFKRCFWGTLPKPIFLGIVDWDEFGSGGNSEHFLEKRLKLS